MALKALLKSLEGLSPEFAAEYKKNPDGDGFILDVDGKDLTAQVREFRTNNVGLEKRIEEVEKQREEDAKKYKGIDLDKYKAGQTLLNQIQDQNERKLMEEGKFEEVYSARSETMRLGHESDMSAKAEIITGLETANKTLRGSLGSMKIEQSLGLALNKAGAKLKKSAMTDIMARTHGTFSVNDDGNIEPLVNGQLIRGPKGDPITMPEYLDDLAKTAPHLFESGGGGGAGGSGTGGSGRTATGKLRLDRTDPTNLSKYHKEIAADQVEWYDG